MAQKLGVFGLPAMLCAASKHHLRDLRRSVYRGLIVTPIHKFDCMLGNLNGRRNGVVPVDEVQRAK